MSLFSALEVDAPFACCKDVSRLDAHLELDARLARKRLVDAFPNRHLAMRPVPSIDGMEVGYFRRGSALEHDNSWIQLGAGATPNDALRDAVRKLAAEPSWTPLDYPEAGSAKEWIIQRCTQRWTPNSDPWFEDYPVPEGLMDRETMVRVLDRVCRNNPEAEFRGQRVSAVAAVSEAAPMSEKAGETHLSEGRTVPEWMDMLALIEVMAKAVCSYCEGVGQLLPDEVVNRMPERVEGSRVLWHRLSDGTPARVCRASRMRMRGAAYLAMGRAKA